MFPGIRHLLVILGPFALATVFAPALAGQVKGPRLDFLGDPLPDGALARHGSVRLRHNGDIRLLSFTPDGKGLLSLGADQTFRQWEVATGKEEWRFAKNGLGLLVPGDSFLQQGSNGFGRWVARSMFVQASCSADGKLLAVADSNNAVIVLDTMTGKQVRKIELKTDCHAITLSRDGKLLAICENAQEESVVRLWEVANGNELVALKVGLFRVVTKLVFSNDSKMVAGILNGDWIRVWNVTNGKRVRLYVHEKGIQRGGLLNPFPNAAVIKDIAFSHDGRLLASAGSDRTVHVWETNSEEELRSFFHDSEFSAVAFTQDGNCIVAGDQRRNLHIWNLATEKHTILPSDAPIVTVAVSPGSSVIAAACSTGAIQLWDTESGQQKLAGKQLRPVSGLGLTDGGRTIVLWCSDGEIRHLDTLTGVARHTAKAPVYENPRIAVAPNGKVAAMINGEEPDIHLWDGVAGVELRKLTGHSCPITSVVFSPDSQSILTTDRESVVRAWSVATGKQTLRMPVYGAGGAFSPDGKLLALAGGGGEVCIFEMLTYKERCRLENTGPSTDLLGFSTDSRYLVTGGDDVLRLWTW